MRNRPKPSHVHKYAICKICLSIMMFICIKQHLINIWSSIHEKVMQHWGWVERKSVAYKTTCITKKIIVVSMQDQSHTVFKTTTTITEQSTLLKSD